MISAENQVDFMLMFSYSQATVLGEPP